MCEGTVNNRLSTGGVPELPGVEVVIHFTFKEFTHEMHVTLVGYIIGHTSTILGVNYYQIETLKPRN